MNAIHPTCCQSLHHTSISSLSSSLSPLALLSFLISYPSLSSLSIALSFFLSSALLSLPMGHSSVLDNEPELGIWRWQSLSC